MSGFTWKHPLRKMRASVLIGLVVIVCALAMGRVANGSTLFAADGQQGQVSLSAAGRRVEYNREGDRDLLPGWDGNINGMNNVTVLDEDEETVENYGYSVTNVEAVSGGELLEEFHKDSDDEGNYWWYYRAGEFGTTTFKVTYETLEGTEDSYTFSVHTVKETADMNWRIDSNGGSTIAFPGESITITAWGIHHQLDEDDNYEGFTYEWELLEGSDLASVSSVPNADGSSTATIKFNPYEGDGLYGRGVRLSITAKKGDLTNTQDLWLDVSNDYGEIWFKELDACTIDPFGFQLGDSITVTPEVRHFKQGTDGYVANEPSNLRWYFDENCFRIVDAQGTAVHDGNEVGSSTFTITRIGDWPSNMGLDATWHNPDYPWADDEGMCTEHTELWFVDSYVHLWFEGDVPDTVIVDGEGTTTLTLGGEHVPDSATIEWTVGLFDWGQWAEDGIFTKGTDYTVSGKTITLNGAQIMKHLDSEEGDGHALHVRVYAEVKLAGDAFEDTFIADADTWIEFFEPAVEYEMEEDCQILIGKGCNVNGNPHVRVWDEDNPYGDERTYQVTDVQVVSGADFVEVDSGTDDEGNRWWWAEANALGVATLKVTYKTLEGTTESYTFQMSVVGTTYTFETIPDKLKDMAQECLLPGERGEVWLQGWRHTAVKETGAQGGTWYRYEDSTDGLTYKWSLAEGAMLGTMVTDASDPTHVTIVMNEKTGDDDHLYGTVSVTCELYDGDKKVAQGGWAYDVGEDYYAVQPYILDDAELLCTTTVDPRVVHRYLDDGGKATEEELPKDKVRVYWSFDEDETLVTNANGEKVVNSEWGDNDTLAGPGPFTITRQRTWGMWYDLMFRWDEGGDERECQAHYQLGNKEYDIAFDKYAYEVGEGGTATLTLDVSDVSGIPGYEQATSITVGTGWNPDAGTFEHPVAPDAYTVTKAQDAWTISMPYETVKQVVDEFGGVGLGVRAVIDLEDDVLYRDAFASVELATAPFFIDADPADDSNHGAEVDWMGRMGISTGWDVPGGREFRGMDNVKRCDFAAFLYRLADIRDNGLRDDSIALTDKQVAATLKGVSDCSPEKTSHAMEVAWMIESGISKGWPDKGKKTVSFKPMANVARQDMAAFLYRFADLDDDQQQNQSLKPGSEKVAFKDVKHGDEANHASEVEWLASVGVTKGWGPYGGKFEFRGTKTVARQDMAAFMYRLSMHMNV